MGSLHKRTGFSSLKNVSSLKQVILTGKLSQCKIYLGFFVDFHKLIFQKFAGENSKYANTIQESTLNFEEQNVNNVLMNTVHPFFTY